MDLLRELDGLSSGLRHSNGRWYVERRLHPCADATGYVASSRFAVENVVGKYLPKTMVVHHVDGDPSNDSNDNLVACENQGYHRLLHVRQKALEACGNVHWRPCSYCHRYDDLSNLKRQGLTTYYHDECVARYRRKRRKKINENSGIFKSDVHILVL